MLPERFFYGDIRYFSWLFVDRPSGDSGYQRSRHSQKQMLFFHYRCILIVQANLYIIIAPEAKIRVCFPAVPSICVLNGRDKRKIKYFKYFCSSIEL